MIVDTHWVEQSQAWELIQRARTNQRLHHAFIVVGQEASLLEEFGRSVAGSYLCLAPAQQHACGSCPSCRLLQAKNHPDFLVASPGDNVSIGVETVRALTQRLALKASLSTNKIAYIEQADTMNPAAQNALLKALEEPPPHTLFILTATRYRKLLLTIRSRCQRLNLGPRTTKDNWRQLLSSGKTELHARVLLHWAHGDLEVAETLGTPDRLAAIDECIQMLATPQPLADVLATIGELTSNKEHSVLLLELVELLFRDGLAKKHGAQADQLLLGDLPVLETLRKAPIFGAAAELQKNREDKEFNLNKTMTFERLLLPLTTKAPPA